MVARRKCLIMTLIFWQQRVYRGCIAMQCRFSLLISREFMGNSCGRMKWDENEMVNVRAIVNMRRGASVYCLSYLLFVVKIETAQFFFNRRVRYLKFLIAQFLIAYRGCILFLSISGSFLSF